MKKPTLNDNRRGLLVAGLIALTLYIVLPQLKDFHSSWHVLSRLDYGWTGLAVFFTGLTYLAAAATYCWLAFKSLPYWLTVEVQLAAMFINRLLPAGVGALGANYAYLRHMKHTSDQAASAVAVNNLLGMLGHGVLTVLVVLVAGDQVKKINHGVAGDALKVGLVVIVAGLVALIIFSRKRWRSKLAGIGKQLVSYRRRPLRLGAALLSSMALTVCNVLCLWAASQAAGVHLPLAVLFIIFTFGVGLAAATPTPGGLGGFEAGLFAGLVAYHVPAGPALAIALLYRLVSYWLALIVGGLALIASQRRHLFSAS